MTRHGPGTVRYVTSVMASAIRGARNATEYAARRATRIDTESAIDEAASAATHYATRAATDHAAQAILDGLSR